uniref:DNA-damage regulated autophagy modulator 1 n=1 Tax=Lepisosteus oculatus TaxID=7918 RepID=W5NDH2_LEPOC|nr:PREDICTED: DNA damage-regulated autophagy modulator protein 1 [Lepisosteus oculatus]
MLWFLEGMCLLPTSLVIWSSVSFVLSYIVALLRRDVDVVFPYISDTGTEPPESCIFGVMITISAFLGVSTMFTRYKFLEKLNETADRLDPRLNLAALCVGIIGCLGMCVVATFQETAIMVVHDLGALLAFVSGVIYILLQSIISYKMRPHGSSLATCHTRMTISIISLIAVFPTIICAACLKMSKLHWDPHDKGYGLHVTSAACEWTVAFGFVCYFLTYIREFQTFTLKMKIQIFDCS